MELITVVVFVYYATSAAGALVDSKRVGIQVAPRKPETKRCSMVMVDGGLATSDHADEQQSCTTSTSSHVPRLPVRADVKYVERVDKHVEEEIDDLRRRRATSKDLFRQNNG